MRARNPEKKSMLVRTVPSVIPRSEYVLMFSVKKDNSSKIFSENPFSALRIPNWVHNNQRVRIFSRQLCFLVNDQKKINRACVYFGG